MHTSTLADADLIITFLNQIPKMLHIFWDLYDGHSNYVCQEGQAWNLFHEMKLRILHARISCFNMGFGDFSIKNRTIYLVID